MANTRIGRCLNFGSCTKADTKENIAVPFDVSDPKCPECGKPLSLAAIRGRAGNPLILLLIVVLALGAGYLINRVIARPQAQVSQGSVPPSPAIAAPVSKAPAFSLCGSNTIGSQLGPDLVRAFLLSLGGSSPVSERTAADEQTVSATVDGKPMSVHVAARGSATAFTGMRSGACQVGMASRRIKSSEAALLHSHGDMLSGSSEHVIGLDGIAVIVNPANPVSSLTVSQVRDIFTGRVATWSNVPGGSGGQIDVFARDDKSGTYDTFKSLVLNELALTAKSRRFEDSSALSAAVSADPHAIGFIGLPYVKDAKALRIASSSLALAPTALTVGRETYPLSRRLFLYTLASPPNALVGRFVAFVQKDAGQKIVNDDGFVGTVTEDITKQHDATAAPPSAPAAYKHLIESFDQAPFNFYFNSGSDVLDNKALVDVGRLVDLMSRPSYRGKSIVLAGFADSTGDYQANKVLSEARAQSAAAELKAQGITVRDTVGFGQELPIRDNSTEEGREQNRRVEIFITR